MNLLSTYSETIVDGEGIRYSIYLAGCNHHCQGCQNPESWNPNAGELLTDEKVSQIISEINQNPLLDGITFSGGDPFYNKEGFYTLIKKIKEATHQNIWCYTGYVYEDLLKDEIASEILKYIDVLVDGPFQKENYSPYLTFKGSSNQRIINLSEGRM